MDETSTGMRVYTPNDSDAQGPVDLGVANPTPINKGSPRHGQMETITSVSNNSREEMTNGIKVSIHHGSGVQGPGDIGRQFQPQSNKSVYSIANLQPPQQSLN